MLGRTEYLSRWPRCLDDHVRPPHSPRASTPTQPHSHEFKRPSTHSEVAGLGKQSGNFLKSLLVLLIKPVLFGAINVDDSHDLVNQSDGPLSACIARATHLPFLDNWHDNLTLTRAITRDVPWELLNVRHELRLHGLRRGTTNTAPERNRLACYLTVEWAEQQLLRVRRIEEVEAAPINAGRRSGQRVIGMPEQGRRVCEVASSVSTLYLHGNDQSCVEIARPRFGVLYVPDLTTFVSRFLQFRWRCSASRSYIPNFSGHRTAR
jgi:hypothetical protein